MGTTTSWSGRRVAHRTIRPGSRTCGTNPEVTVEADGKKFQATATVAEGADRDALWDSHVAEHPQFAEYLTKTDRVIPIARLTPLG